MLSLNKLPWKNLRGYAGRTLALIAFAILMTAASFEGTLLVRGVKEGLEAIRSRLGADILVTPADAKNEFDAQTVLLQAEPGYFYMDAGILEEIQSVPGVEKVSPQLFLASASSGCCSAKLQIIAFDPQTDFTIQPWIRESFGAQKMGLMDIIVGSNVTIYDDYIIRLYGNDCHVIGQFAPTGSTLDNAVYTDFETIKVLLQSSFDIGLNKYSPFDIDGVISSAAIKVQPNENIETIAEEIRNRIEGVSVVTSTNMISGIAASLAGISRTVNIFIILFWLIGLIMTLLIFSLMIHERKREFASLQAAGAGKNILRRIVTEEALIVFLSGGCLGIVLSGCIITSFRTLIEQKLGMSFLIPPAGQTILLGVFSLIAMTAAAGLTSFIASGQLTRMDACLILKEGE